jgi:ceramide glucosyltransferase
VIRRWFIFPRESLMRHLALRDSIVLYGLGMLPALLPAALIAAVVRRPSRIALAWACIPIGFNLGIFAHLNSAYLRRSTPWRSIWLVPVAQIVFPLEVVLALLAPQRINWRGHIIEVERGGSLRLIRRR